MRRRRHSQGRFHIGGDKNFPTAGSALSAAQYAACHAGEDTNIYVREVANPLAIFRVERRGKIITTLTLDQSRAA